MSVIPLTEAERASMVASDLRRHDTISLGIPLDPTPSEAHRREFLGTLQEIEPATWPRAIRAFRAYLESVGYELPEWFLEIEATHPPPGGTP